jgi:hypothetical protein
MPGTWTFVHNVHSDSRNICFQSLCTSYTNVPVIVPVIYFLMSSIETYNLICIRSYSFLTFSQSILDKFYLRLI